MKAFVLRSYGSPDVLDLMDIDKPVPGDDEVLVRVRATSVNPYDWHSMRGEPFIARLMGLGLRNPKHLGRRHGGAGRGGRQGRDGVSPGR
jgi:NADPH:quinone reductase-like Zn-dependent oxidoreductase